jgi:hypothetical protein
MINNNKMPGFNAEVSLNGLTDSKGSFAENRFEINKSDLIVQAGCFTYSRCQGVFRKCTTCCVEAAAGGTIRTYCYPERVCGLCGIDTNIRI